MIRLVCLGFTSRHPKAYLVTKMKKSYLLLVLVIASGCTTTYPEINAVESDTPPDGTAKLVFTRDNAKLYLALGAKIKVDGEKIGKLSRRDTVSKIIVPGKVQVDVYTATAFGRYGVTINATAGTVYYFKVSPRKDSFIPVALVGYAGNLIDTTVNEQSGLFQLELTRIVETNQISISDSSTPSINSNNRQESLSEEMKQTVQAENKPNFSLNATTDKKDTVLDKAAKKCAELGYKKGTEKFADCSLKLLDEFKQSEYQ